MLLTKKNNFKVKRIAVADKNGKWWYKSCCFKHKCAPIKKWNECIKCKTEEKNGKAMCELFHIPYNTEEWVQRNRERWKF